LNLPLHFAIAIPHFCFTLLLGLGRQLENHQLYVLILGALVDIQFGFSIKADL
jgi:hypothetical protein